MSEPMAPDVTCERDRCPVSEICDEVNRCVILELRQAGLDIGTHAELVKVYSERGR